MKIWFTVMNTEDGVHQIEQLQESKDIGVTVDSLLSFKQRIYRKIDTANKIIIGIIRRAHKYLDTEMFIPLYKCLIRSHFDYPVTVCDPHLKFIDNIESVQRRATVLIPEIKNFIYPKRLQKLGYQLWRIEAPRGE